MRMRNHLLISALLLIVGCTEYLNPVNLSEGDNNKSPLTKSIVTDSYYWYKGQKIPLTLNQEYVNLICSNSRTNDLQLKTLSENHDVEMESLNSANNIFKVKFNATQSKTLNYQSRIDELKKVSGVDEITPYYERGIGKEPIGTSDIFYVRLKGVDQYDLPIELQEYDTTSLMELCEEHGVRILRSVDYMPDWYVLSITGSDFDNSVDAANHFYESNLFADVDPAFMFNFQANAVNDPMFSQQWGLNNSSNPAYDINIEGAWAITKGYGARIAIIDQGVDISHNDLPSNYSYVHYDAQQGSSISSENAISNHGTHVAGIMTAIGNNNLQIAGVAYEAQLMRISHDLMSIRNIGEELASGISWAWLNGADVINCSWGDSGGEYYNQIYSPLLESAIENALMHGRSQKGTVVVFAAGNCGESGPIMNYPGTCDDRILTVGSINNTGMRSLFSGYGSKLDVVAPGEYILSTLPNDAVGYASGTSMAAPHVSGAAALMIAANPNLTRESVVRIIEQTAQKISPNGSYTYYQYQNRYNGDMNVEVGYGLIDAAKAVAVAKDAGTYPSNSNPRLDYYVMSGAAAYYDNWFVMGGYQNTTVSFSLKASQINPSYSYYWHFTTSGDYGWHPSFDYVGDETGVIVNIPRPSMNSTITMRCEIYNGTTHVCTAVLPLTVHLNFP
jgi:subtilisin family serine protease